MRLTTFAFVIIVLACNIILSTASFSGVPFAGSVGNSTGNGQAALINPGDGQIAIDSHNVVYVADSNNGVIRSITPKGVETIIGGSGNFLQPTGLVFDPSDSTILYVGDQGTNSIQKITLGATVTVQTVRAVGGQLAGHLAIGGSTIYAIVGTSVVAISTNGSIQTSLSFGTTFTSPFQIAYASAISAFSGDAGLFLGDASTSLYALDLVSSTSSLVSSTLSKIGGIAVSGSNVYVTDSVQKVVLSYSYSASTWSSTTVLGQAGTSGVPSYNSVSTSSILFQSPESIAFYSSGDFLLVDSNTLILCSNSAPGPIANFTFTVASGASTTISFSVDMPDPIVYVLPDFFGVTFTNTNTSTSFTQTVQRTQTTFNFPSAAYTFSLTELIGTEALYNIQVFAGNSNGNGSLSAAQQVSLNPDGSATTTVAASATSTTTTVASTTTTAVATTTTAVTSTTTTAAVATTTTAVVSTTTTTAGTPTTTSVASSSTTAASSTPTTTAASSSSTTAASSTPTTTVVSSSTTAASGTPTTTAASSSSTTTVAGTPTTTSIASSSTTTASGTPTTTVASSSSTTAVAGTPTTTSTASSSTTAASSTPTTTAASSSSTTAASGTPTTTAASSSSTTAASSTPTTTVASSSSTTAAVSGATTTAQGTTTASGSSSSTGAQNSASSSTTATSSNTTGSSSSTGAQGTTTAGSSTGSSNSTTGVQGTTTTGVSTSSSNSTTGVQGTTTTSAGTPSTTTTTTTTSTPTTTTTTSTPTTTTTTTTTTTPTTTTSTTATTTTATSTTATSSSSSSSPSSSSTTSVASNSTTTSNKNTSTSGSGTTSSSSTSAVSSTTTTGGIIHGVAPQVTAATLSSDGTTIDIDFNEPTNLAGAASFGSSYPVDCSSIFATTLLNTFGSPVSCYFSSSSELSVVLGTSTPATITVGSTISLISSNTILDITTTSSSAVGSATLNAPDDVISPSVSFSGPKQIGACTPFTLSASSSSGAAGRLFKTINWSSSTQGLLSVLNSASGSLSLTIPAASLTPGNSYTINIQLINWLGASSTSSFSFSVSSLSLPTVQILNNNDGVTQFPRYNAITMQATTSYTNCNGTSIPLSLLWSVSPSVSGLVGQTSQILTIPANTLTFNTVYTFSFTATALHGASNSDSMQISVIPQGPEAVISGATLYGSDETITLSGALSVDRDHATNLPLDYSWVGVSGGIPANVTSSSATLSVLPHILAVGSYSFQLTVTAYLNNVKSSFLTDTQIVSITILNSDPPTVSIAPMASLQPSSSSIAIIGTVVPRLSTSTVKLSWTVTGASVDLTAAGAVDTSLSSATLVINANVLVPADYTFRLSANETSGNSSVVGYAEVSFTVPQIPLYGSITVSPLNGSSLLTQFTFSTSGWVVSASPASYVFYYSFLDSSNNPGAQTTVSFKSYNTNKNSILIASPSTTSTVNVQACVVVYDSTDNSNTACSDFTVSPVTLSSDQIGQITNDQANSQVNNGDYTGASSTIGAGSDAANTASTPSSKRNLRSSSSVSSTTDLRSSLLATLGYCIDQILAEGQLSDPATLQIDVGALASIVAQPDQINITIVNDAITYTSTLLNAGTQSTLQAPTPDTFLDIYSSLLDASSSSTSDNLQNTIENAYFATGSISENLLDAIYCGQSPLSSTSDYISFVGVRACSSVTSSSAPTSYSHLSSSGVSVVFPQSLFTYLNQDVTGDYKLTLFQFAVPLASETSNSQVMGVWMNSPISSIIVSNSNGGQVSLNSTQINANIFVTLPYYHDYNTSWVPSCVSYNGSVWAENICVVNSTNSDDKYVVCSCSEASVLALSGKIATASTSGSSDSSEATEPRNITVAVAVPVVIGGVIIIAVIVVLIVRKKPTNKVLPSAGPSP